MITLSHNECSVSIDPLRGGGITHFSWNERPVFLPARIGDPTPLGLACFVMLPFANRIAKGTFAWNGKTIRLPTNCVQASERHSIHGHGWQNPWMVEKSDDSSLTLVYKHSASSWPWDYEARQTVELTKNGYRHHLAIINQSAEAMPAGLGLHPYFPRRNACLQTRFESFWPTGEDELPELEQVLTAPVKITTQDQVYSNWSDDILIIWPDHQLRIKPDRAFRYAHLYVPTDHGYFCLEPVSHVTDAENAGGVRILGPGEIWSTKTQFDVSGQL